MSEGIKAPNELMKEIRTPYTFTVYVYSFIKVDKTSSKVYAETVALYRYSFQDQLRSTTASGTRPYQCVYV